jgi:hypothetical protein
VTGRQGRYKQEGEDKNSMKGHPLRAIVYHSSLVIAGIFAVGVQAADMTGLEEIFEATLNDCVKKRFDELSGWDWIVYSIKHDAESAQRCRTEVITTLQMMEDKQYTEKQTTDAMYREQMTHVDKFTGKDSGKLFLEGAEIGFSVIRFDPKEKRRSEIQSKSPIETAPGYTTNSGSGE